MIYKIVTFKAASYAAGNMLSKPISVEYSLTLEKLDKLDNVLVDLTFLTSVGGRWTRHIITDSKSIYVSIVGIL